MLAHTFSLPFRIFYSSPFSIYLFFCVAITVICWFLLWYSFVWPFHILYSLIMFVHSREGTWVLGMSRYHINKNITHTYIYIFVSNFLFIFWHRNSNVSSIWIWAEFQSDILFRYPRIWGHHNCFLSRNMLFVILVAIQQIVLGHKKISYSQMII